MDNENIVSGAIPSRPDNRDFKWETYPQSFTPFDWDTGYEVPITLKAKDQNGSGSCGGQAWSYYGEVLSTIYDKIYTPKSAKFIYAQTFVPGGGSAGRENCKIVKGQGWADEEVLTSYDNGKAPSEAFMQRSSDITQAVRDNAFTDMALTYANVTDLSIDGIATAVASNYGCIIGIAGSNNGTWRTKFPKAPKAGETLWWHWLYVCGAVVIDGVKYLKVKNSWGNGTPEFQYISEDYLNAGKFGGNNVVFEAWTLIFNEENRVKRTKLGLMIKLLEVYKKLYLLLTGKTI